MNQHERDFITKAVGELGSAIGQSLPSDNQIIMDHVRSVYYTLKTVLKISEPHRHVAGTTIGKSIDVCAICGNDLRHEIHARH